MFRAMTPLNPLIVPTQTPVLDILSAPVQQMVVLRPSGEGAPEESDARVLPSWEAFMQTQVAPLGFYLDGWTAQAQNQLAEQVRRSAWWSLPVLVSPGADDAPLLADGAVSYGDALAMGERALAAHRSLRLDPASLHLDERVLYFLYLRDHPELKPLCDRHSPMLYRYPLAEALAHSGEDVAACLEALTRRRLLEPSTLIDRTRHCRACGCAHLHYLDVCPHCSSLQIRKAASLHCFACGHVAPEDDFKNDGALGCPKCSVALRHIGVDYDRPLTQYACASCHHAFMETSVLARCLDCSAMHQPSALDVREIAALRLSPHGRAALRAGQMQESLAALDAYNYVEPAQFRRMLDWALATQTRHAEIRFGLMLVQFKNTAQVIEEQGAARVFLMLDEFARRLHELLRTSDISTRTEEEMLWLLLPFSSTEGLATRLETALADLSSGDGVASLQASIRHLQAPRDLQSGDQAVHLMARLQDRG